MLCPFWDDCRGAASPALQSQKRMQHREGLCQHRPKHRGQRVWKEVPFVNPADNGSPQRTGGKRAETVAADSRPMGGKQVAAKSDQSATPGDSVEIDSEQAASGTSEYPFATTESGHIGIPPAPLPKSDRRLLKNAIVVVLVAAAAALVVTRFDDVMALLGMVWNVASPLLAGTAIAYLLNLVMSRIERIFFPHSKNAVVRRLRRPICLILTIALIAVFVALVVALVSGELSEALPALAEGLAWTFDAARDWLVANGVIGENGATGISALLSGDAATLQESLKSAIDQLGGMGALASLAVSAGRSVSGVAVHTVVAIVFALYLLIGKERALAGCKTFATWALPERVYARVSHVASVANECFSRFIFGQCLEGTILGCLCALGMTILGMPYAAVIGLCVGVTSLVPLVGAWVGGILGALMILSVDPMQAVWFVLFLVVLQQIEGHVIYPNVVGTSVGVPGIWVLVGVFVGGSLFGVVGILLSVPLIATGRHLAQERNNGTDSPVAKQEEPV